MKSLRFYPFFHQPTYNFTRFEFNLYVGPEPSPLAVAYRYAFRFSITLFSRRYGLTAIYEKRYKDELRR